MTYTHGERLSALDGSFLALEDHSCHMHIGAIGIFEAAPLRTPDGGIDVDRIRALMRAGLHRMPRYRQRLAWTPLFKHPVWIDDARFNLAYHVRHTHLPRPGDERQLKRLVGRLMSQQLDRGKPLWEMWVIEGLEGDRFAIITKAHHCMIDGVGSVALMGAVMRPSAEDDPREHEPPSHWYPRPAPAPQTLFAEELRYRITAPIDLLQLVRRAAATPRESAAQVRDTAGGLLAAMLAGFSPASPTPLNVEIGPHRRFDWSTMDLARIRAVKEALGGTINDVVLAILTGALRRFFLHRGIAVEGLDFRAMLPVNLRAAGQHLGNRVAMMSVRLPIDERDPRRRLARVVDETTAAKGSHEAAGMHALEEVSDRTFTTLFTEFARLASMALPYNVVVTNVPGPQFPVYVLGSRMLACYPVVPLFKNQGLGVALFSYDGQIHWGFNADWDTLPDLHDLVAAVAHEFDVMCGSTHSGGIPVVQAAAS